MLTTNDTLKDRLAQLLELYQNGRLDEAEKAARTITTQFPKHPFAWKVLSTVLARTGRTPAAVRAARKAVDLAPSDFEALSNLGNMLEELGKFDEAEKSYRQAISKKPDFADAYYNLGILLSGRNGSEEALDNFAKAVTFNPRHFTAFNNLGVLQKKMGRLDDAILSYKKAVAVKPNFAEAHNNLGNVYKQLEKPIAARDSYISAIQSEPNFAEAHANLGGALQALGRLEEAEASCRKALALNSSLAEAYNNLANTLQDFERLEEAEVNYFQAITVQPDYVDGYLNLCELLESQNRIEDLMSVLESAVGKVAGGHADLLFFKALARFREEDMEGSKQIAESIKIGELTDGRKPAFWKLNGELRQHSNEYAEAFHSFKTMNEQVTLRQDYKRGEARDYFASQEETLAKLRESKDKTRNLTAYVAAWAQPVFLVGFPRSGTTLLDTVLRTHSSIDVVEERPMVSAMEEALADLSLSTIEGIGPKEAKKISSVYFDELDKHLESGKSALVVDKLPLNIFRLPLINRIFPQARYILALRHPLDCVLSCWMQNFQLNAAMANMVDLNQIVELYGMSMETLRLCQARYDLDVCTTRYEDLVEGFDTEVQKILRFLGLNWEKTLSNYRETALARGKINTPSYHQVTKPIYKNAAYRWRNYEEFLVGQKKKLQPWIDEFGY